MADEGIFTIIKPSEMTVEILYHSEENHSIIMGGDGSNPSWEEYLEQWPASKQRFALVKEAIQNAGFVGMTGAEHESRGITFKFSDGLHWGFTWRAWGDLMQAIVNKREGYMKYYM